MPRDAIGYCTNCHAGTTLDALINNLDRFAGPIRRRLGGDAALPVGLWLAPDTAAQLAHDADTRATLRDALARNTLCCRSINAFPQLDFHQHTVKHAVYRPDWTSEARARYTRDVAEVLAATGEPDAPHLSISTLPIGWASGDAARDRQRCADAGRQLLGVVEYLVEVGQRTGREVHLDLEPEPGCLLSTTHDAVGFLKRHVWPLRDDDAVRRHLGVCHDVCHAAVEDLTQIEALDALQTAGVRLGKLQLTSALRIDWHEAAAADQLRALRALDEPRFLHQCRTRVGDAVHRFDDLPDLPDPLPPGTHAITCHHHVPIHLQHFRGIPTTRGDIAAALAHPLIKTDDPVLEVETYTHPLLTAEADAVGQIAAEVASACATVAATP